MNPKILQYIMDHSDISITLDAYTHLGLLVDNVSCGLGISGKHRPAPQLYT